MAERIDDLFVHRPLEGNDELRQAVHRLPVPSVELGLVIAGGRIDLDFAFIAVEAEGESAQGLAAIFAA